MRYTVKFLSAYQGISHYRVIDSQNPDRHLNRVVVEKGRVTSNHDGEIRDAVQKFVKEKEDR